MLPDNIGTQESPNISEKSSTSQREENEHTSNATANQQTDDQNLKRRGSASRASSLVDDPKSIDSISASWSRQNWSGKGGGAEDDPSISSIKGDSISATIADYDRKHLTQPRTGIESDSNTRTYDQTSGINFYAAGGGSTSSTADNVHNSQPDNFADTTSNPSADVIDVIEESSNVSSCDNLSEKEHLPRINRQRVSSLEQALEIENLPQDIPVYQIEPIILRGNGNLTLFGLSNSFSSEFPPALIGRVSREEFNRTMRRVNSLLREQQSLSALKKRSKTSLEKFLCGENNRLYSKLGLNWRLAEQRCYSNHAFVEDVLMIEFTPKINLYLPD